MKKMFWVDLEMTGLDENKCHIIEVAVAVTLPDLEVLESYEQVVFQPPQALAVMDEWCQKTHGASGLTQAVPQGRPLADVELDLLKIIDRHFAPDERIVLCGNSVGNDKRFIDKYLQKIASRLHYRIVDVSSFKEVFRARWGVDFQKSDGHRAQQDLLESIAELRHYLSFVKI